MKKILIVLALSILSVSKAINIPLSSSGKYVKIVNISTCYHVGRNSDGGNVWTPAIKVKFIPKVSLNYASLKGTFVDLNDNSALGGGALDNTTDLESNVAYTLTIYSSQGWTMGGISRKIKITPHMELNNYDAGIDLNITLGTITKISTSECGD